MSQTLGPTFRSYLGERHEEMVSFLLELAGFETPSTQPETLAPALDFFEAALAETGFRVRRIRGRSSGGHLLAMPKGRPRGVPGQLLMGHLDTVWPLGTLESMPLIRKNGRLRGPGVFDMKGGLTLIVFALRALRDLGLQPPATPVVLVNSDEEIGSPESRRIVRLVAKNVARAFILEPPLGLRGDLKTARKGVGRFEVKAVGKAAHAGLDPDAGASAILELSHVIQALHALNDRERGVSVNVGVVDGGLRPNVVAPESVAHVDVRVPTMIDAREVERAIRALTPSVPGVRLEVTGGIGVPPLERTPRNQALWRAAREAGVEVGLDLNEALAGGGSDGNTTSQYTATLDGMGPVGDGAHAVREHILVDSLVERGALLARMLMWELPETLPPASQEAG
jgi:glutamate carboxypeptidase